MVPYAISVKDLLYNYTNGKLNYAIEQTKMEETLTGANLSGGPGDRLTPWPITIDKRTRVAMQLTHVGYEYWGQWYTYSQNGPTGSYAECLPWSNWTDWSSLRSRADVIYNDALESVYQQMKSTSNASANAAVSIAESPETLRMFKSALKAVGAMAIGLSHMKKDFVKFLSGDKTTPFSNNRRLRWQHRRRLQRMKRLGIRDFAQVPASLWLLNTYGIGPLLADIHAYREYVAGRMKLDTDGGFATVESRERWKGSASQRLAANPAYTAETTLSERCLVNITFGVDDAQLAELKKITSVSPALVAWELIPLSFVVDWVVNVGQYLSLVEAAAGSGLTFKRGFVTTGFLYVSKHRYYAQATYDGGSAGKKVGFTAAQGSSRWSGKNRRVLTGFPRPAYPKVDVQLGSKRLISAAALLKTLFIK